jgi:hypothetical protein
MLIALLDFGLQRDVPTEALNQYRRLFSQSCGYGCNPWATLQCIKRLESPRLNLSGLTMTAGLGIALRVSREVLGREERVSLDPRAVEQLEAPALV